MDQDRMLGTEPVGKLLWKLAVPTVVAQLVNMLYNIVDREGAFVDMPGQDYNNIQQIRAFAKARHAWTETYINGEPTVNLWNISERTLVKPTINATKDTIPNHTMSNTEYCLGGARSGIIYNGKSGSCAQIVEMSGNDVTLAFKEGGIGLLMPVELEAGATYRLKYTADSADVRMALTWYDADTKYVGNMQFDLTNGLTYDSTFIAPNYPKFAIGASSTIPSPTGSIKLSDVSLVKLL